jgi:phage/plasmid primase-like uncharacterized protein
MSGNLSNIFGGAWSPPKEIKTDSPETQLRDAMLSAGLSPPNEILFDGKLHRFNSGTKGKAGHDKPGWYVVFSDGIPSGRFGCWRAGVEVTFCADIGRTLTDSEKMVNARRLAEARTIRDADLKRTRDMASDTVEKIWSDGMLATPEHPYLARKGIGLHGARMTGDGRLMLPLYTPEGKLASLQYIDAEGGKLYHSGGQTGGCFWMVGTLDEAGTIYVAEGFATAATINEVTNRPCIVAYSASNLVPVTGTIREKYGASQDIVIVSDNDASGTGQKYADQASAKYGARVVMPPSLGDANDYVAEGGDLKLLLQPDVSDWLIPADEFSTTPRPIKWLIKGWVQEEALIMVHGPSGGGKTFVVLDWCLRIAAGLTEWNGNKVKAGPIVYLAGEGHHGLRGRIAAWKQENNVSKLDMWLSKAGCDLNTPEGYLKVVESIRALPVPPSVITVDTLHRFLAGDENSAQDAKTMIDACANLMREFNCTIVLVHHTGVSDEAQHRARGSSAWKGALEIEVSVIPAKGSMPMQIVQRKSKDSEMAPNVYVELRTVEIRGWVDEDGEPVKSAVLDIAEAPPERKKDSKLDAYKKLFSDAWWASGAEVEDGLPFVTRSALLNYIIPTLDLSEKSGEQYLKPSDTTKFIGMLTVGQIVERKGHGWVVICEDMGSTMMVRKNGERNEGNYG